MDDWINHPARMRLVAERFDGNMWSEVPALRCPCGLHYMVAQINEDLTIFLDRASALNWDTRGPGVHPCCREMT